MSTQSNASKAATLALLQAVISGTQKHFSTGPLTIENTVYTEATLVPLFQSLADAITALNTAQKNAEDALTAVEGSWFRNCLLQEEPKVPVSTRKYK